jgi:hypothetical protein
VETANGGIGHHVEHNRTVQYLWLSPVGSNHWMYMYADHHILGREIYLHFFESHGTDNYEILPATKEDVEATEEDVEAEFSLFFL